MAKNKRIQIVDLGWKGEPILYSPPFSPTIDPKHEQES